MNGGEGGNEPALAAFTVGGVRDVITWRGFEAAVGGAVTVYGSPMCCRAPTAAIRCPFRFSSVLRRRRRWGACGTCGCLNRKMGHGMSH